MTYKIAGSRRPDPQQPELHVDYADVLRQAVENERVKVLREVQAALGSVPTHDVRDRGYAHSGNERTASQFQRDAERLIEMLWPK